MFLHERPIRFEEVDAAGLVFFPRFLGYAHEAMEAFFGSLDGGYAGLILGRRIGLPAVDVRSRFHSPVRYGDTLAIETRTARLGTRSAVLSYRMRPVGRDVVAVEIEHTVVSTDLVKMASTDMPTDVRAVLESHASVD